MIIFILGNLIIYSLVFKCYEQLFLLIFIVFKFVINKIYILMINLILWIKYFRIVFGRCCLLGILILNICKIKINYFYKYKYNFQNYCKYFSVLIVLIRLIDLFQKLYIFNGQVFGMVICKVKIFILYGYKKLKYLNQFIEKVYC